METVNGEEFEKMFEKMLAGIEAAKQKRAEKMPDEKAALAQMFEAYTRLKEMGWNDAIYCPKGGAIFSAITAGSTGIHKCNYIGEWPNGSWWIYDGDVWPASPILYRKRLEDDPDVDLGPAMDNDAAAPSTPPTEDKK